MLVLGPIIFGLLIGFIIGTRLKISSKNSFKFTLSSFIVIFILTILMAWQLGPYPFYNDLPIATGFLSGAIGLLLGKLIFIKRVN